MSRSIISIRASTRRRAVAPLLVPSALLERGLYDVIVACVGNFIRTLRMRKPEVVVFSRPAVVEQVRNQAPHFDPTHWSKRRAANAISKTGSDAISRIVIRLGVSPAIPKCMSFASSLKPCVFREANATEVAEERRF